MRRAKIVATIGPATESADGIRTLIEAGVNIVRINMSHGDRPGHARVIERVRAGAAQSGVPVGIMLDLSGPKIRTGRLKNGQAELVTGSEARIVGTEIEGTADRFSAGYPRIAEDVHSGDRILIGDGEIELKVLDSAGGEVRARVIHGGILGERKGLSFPGASLSISSVTEKDVEDLRFGMERGVDIVAQSFVRNAADCRRARELIREFGGDARLIAKIEKPQAVEDLENILAVSDGVMVARGDLAVETSPEIVPQLQKKIIAAASSAQKTAITATQMLQSMVENPRPTRAEASDVANAVLDGSDAVMLSAETAVGRFPAESVSMMDRIIRSAEEIETEESRRLAGLLRRQTGACDRAIAEAARFAAEEIGSRLIVVFTDTGDTARSIAGLRPRQRIIAFCTTSRSCRQLALSWGVEPHVLEGFPSVSNELLAVAGRALIQQHLASSGEQIVVMAGRLPNTSFSMMMKIHTVTP
jgi:pyruvate kinase